MRALRVHGAAAAHVESGEADVAHATVQPAPPVKPLLIDSPRGSAVAAWRALLNVRKVTAILWKRGRRRLIGTALRLLYLVRKQPNALQQV